MSRRGVALLVLALLAAGHCALYYPALIDDAYIGYRYAWSLAHGDGLVFNPGERVEGMTHLLWVLVAAGVIAVTDSDPHFFMWGLGIASACGSAAVLYLLGEEIFGRRGRVFAWAAPLIALSRAGFAYHACAGLETALFALLLAVALWMVWRGGLGARAGVVLVLADLNRPETPYFAALLAAVAWLRHRGTPRWSRRGVARCAVVFGAGWLARMAFRLAYYGELVPNTYWVKAMPIGLAVEGGARYALDYLHHTHFVPAIALVLVALARDRVCLLLAGLWLASLLPVFLFGGDWMPLFRFFAHVLPFEALLITGGIASAAALLPRALRGPPPLWPGLLLAAAVALALVAGAPKLREVRETYQDFYDHVHELGEWIREQPEVHSFATYDVGVMGFDAKKRVVDLGGLTDRTIAKAQGTMVDKQYDPGYVFAQNPELIVFRTPGPAVVRTPEGTMLAPEALIGSERRLYEHPTLRQRYTYQLTLPAGMDSVIDPTGVRRMVVSYAYHVYGRNDVRLVVVR
jgi:hypothetical protein